VCLQCCSKLVINNHWVVEIVRQRVPGHRADNRECPMTELAVTMLEQMNRCTNGNVYVLMGPSYTLTSQASAADIVGHSGSVRVHLNEDTEL